MALKGGYDKGKALEKDYKKRCSNCGKLKINTKSRSKPAWTSNIKCYQRADTPIFIQIT